MASPDNLLPTLDIESLISNELMIFYNKLHYHQRITGPKTGAEVNNSADQFQARFDSCLGLVIRDFRESIQTLNVPNKVPAIHFESTSEEERRQIESSTTTKFFIPEEKKEVVRLAVFERLKALFTQVGIDVNGIDAGEE